MGPEGFRKLAASIPGAAEREHMQHPDFRIGGKIFATLGYPDEHFAMVKLTPEQQKQIVAAYPEVFLPVKGKWGEQGSTNLRLRLATTELAKRALQLAAGNVALPKVRTRSRAK